MKIIPVKLKNNSYNIYIADGLLPQIPGHLKKLNIGNFGIILASPKIYSLHKKQIDKIFKPGSYKIIPVCDGEKAKSKTVFLQTIDKIVQADSWNKKIFIVCLGGGTIGDLGGFIASIYKRGIPYVQIPTTLLSQIDSSIGGKTGIDLPTAKNILGRIYQPKAVFIDPGFLRTLPENEIKQGIAEAIKYAVISSESFFRFLEKNRDSIKNLESASISRLIYTCAATKVKVVEEDEFEKKGVRTILNFGHTFGHALETSLKYRNLAHGEAVAIGMCFIARLSALMGKYQPDNRLEALIKAFGLPDRIKADSQTVLNALLKDKKFISGKIRMVLLKKIGQVEVVDGLNLQLIKKSLKTFLCA